MNEEFSIISPADGHIVATRRYATIENINNVLEKAATATCLWRAVDMDSRAEILSHFITVFENKRKEIAKSITLQMGRPICFSPGEVSGVAARATKMIELGKKALAPQYHETEDQIERYIEREALGTLLIIAPWNYPFLTVINSLIPALLSGNSVIIKHSQFTALCAEILVECLTEAGLPEGVCQYLHLTGESTEKLLGTTGIDGVVFTGSVRVGRRVELATAGRFIPVGLELGGKDAAYVRPDADIAFSAENLVEGALFNSGQSCCGIERIYVHTDIYSDFVELVAHHAQAFHPGLPDVPETLMGPVINKDAALNIQAQLDAACLQGAKPLLEISTLSHLPDTGTYLQPQFLLDVNHDMTFMREETFGPNGGIMAVNSDDEAIGLINDSEFGLSASLWTADKKAARNLGQHIDAGTIFMNRCDYLDPSLTWSGRKNSGRGYSLGEYGFLQVTRPKSYHLRSL